MGDRAEIVVEAPFDPTVKLVPLGALIKDNEVDAYVFEFKVKINKPADLTVEVIQDSVTLGGGTLFTELIIIQLSEKNNITHHNPIHQLLTTFIQIDQNRYYKTVYAKLFIVAPEDPADYEEAYTALRNQQISFSLKFKASR